MAGLVAECVVETAAAGLVEAAGAAGLAVETGAAGWEAG